MSFCIDSQGREQGNDPRGPSLTQQKQQSLSPAGTHSSESPSRSMLATYAGNLWCTTTCSTSSSSFFMREDSACKANSYKERREPSKQKVTDINLLPTCCLVLLFQQPHKGGERRKLLRLPDHHASPSNQNNRYLTQMKQAYLKPFSYLLGLLLRDRNSAGRWEAARAELISLPTLAVQGQGNTHDCSSNVRAPSPGSRHLPTAKGLESWQGAWRATPPGRSEIQLHTLPSSLPSMAVRFISTWWRDIFLSAERNVKMQLSVVYTCDSCSHKVILRLCCFCKFVFQK